jgi:uncharacterized protein (TIGR03382 family)
MKSTLTASRIGMMALALGLVSIGPSTVKADFTNRVLLLAPGSLGGAFQSTQNFLSTVGTQTLDINVDYAVWGPGQFPGNYVPFAGFTPLVPSDYVYAFQVYDNGPGNGQSTRQFSQLGINSIGGTVSSLGKDPTFDPSGVDVDTNFAFLSPQGASYQFLVPAIGINQFSVVLLLSSPQAPNFAQASVFDSGLSAHGNLPMPTPAPGTIPLMALGAAALFRRSR